MTSSGVFISHSATDGAFAEALQWEIEAAGVKVWRHETHTGANDLSDTLGHAIAKRPSFVLLLSPAAFSSVFVKEEWQIALALRRSPLGGTRQLVAVTVQPYEETVLTTGDAWTYLNTVRRIERPDHQPYPQAVAIDLTLVALDLLHPATLLRDGEALNEQREHGKALVVLERAAQLVELYNAEEQFRLYDNLSWAYHETHQFEAARMAAEQETRLKQDHTAGWANLGWALAGLEQYVGARAAYQHALSLDARNAAAWNLLGDAERQLGQHAEAVAAYQRALDLRPKEADVWKSQGDALKALGRMQEAVVAYTQAFDLRRTDATLAHALELAQSHLGMDDAARKTQFRHAMALATRLREQERWELARDHYQEAIVLAPDNANAHRLLGSVYSSMGQWQAALEATNAALALDPEFVVAWNNKGWALRKLGRLEEALAAYDQAVALESAKSPNTYAYPYNGRGLVLHDLGRESEAIAAFKEALAIKPEWPECRRNLERALKAIGQDE